MGQGFSGNNVLRYGVRSVPFAVLIDQQGWVVLTGIGPEAVEVYLEENL